MCWIVIAVAGIGLGCWKGKWLRWLEDGFGWLTRACRIGDDKESDMELVHLREDRVMREEEV